MAISVTNKVQFHDTAAERVIGHHVGPTTRADIQFTYTFENLFHPYVSELMERLNHKPLPDFFDPVYHQGLRQEFFESAYKVLSGDLVQVHHSPKEIDFSAGGPYANYNWELLFHVPLTIAVHLSKNRRFAEAQRFFHLIMNPTANDTAVPVPQRFWQFLPFRSAGQVKQIDEQLAILSKPDKECTSDELELKGKLLQGYEAIKNKPFQPHVVARTRQMAYQYCVVMKYLDNLIAWGDSLFQQDTVESINEATQIYVLAANLLGARPQRIPLPGNVRSKTYAELKAQGLDPMGNALVALEGKFPLNLGAPQPNVGDPNAAGPLFGIGRTLYFCIPRNQKMLGYWDTVGDRLFKIRHCMNIEGVVRQLALFDPPIDPGMLVKAAAAGIDIGSIVSGLSKPAGPVRALFLIQKALELCAEVRGLGASLLAAIEKGDGEKITLLRQSHEVTIQQMQLDVRFLQWASAQEAIKSLLASRGAALERLHYYQRLLNLPADPNAPDTLPLDFATLDLNEENFTTAYTALVGQYDKKLALEPYPPLSLTDEGRAKLNLTTTEDDEFVHSKTARDTGMAATITNAVAAGLVTIPDGKVKLSFWGIGADVDLKIGSALVAAAKIPGDILEIIAAWEKEQSSLSARTAGYDRRGDEWRLQHNLAAHELMQIGRQVLTALIAEQLAHHDYLTTKQQIDNAQEVERVLKDKFSNEELYTWMQGELSRLYYEYYRFAFDTARKAERAMKLELMRPEMDAQDYIQFNYWDGGRKGLLAGEALYLDVKRMELAYHDNDKRELELTRHVSLRQLDPLALLTLKATGSCQVAIPEWLFDLDGPGQYMRRIKSVALSIPSVVGPYSSVNCTLSLLRSSVRRSPIPLDGEYLRQGAEDSRFVDYAGAVQSIVTSSAQNDTGTFEANLRDERPLPFEGAGAISTWKLALPVDYPAFDYATIADVILHIRYTARLGVDPTKVRSALGDLFQQADDSRLALLFSLRYDFPSEWSAFVHGVGDFTASISMDYFPYLVQNKPVTLQEIDLYDGENVARHHAVESPGHWATETAALADKTKRAFGLAIAADAAGPTQVLRRDEEADLFLVVRYTLG